MTGWHYLLLVNIYLLLFYGFYVLLLRKETFFQLNRVYLVAASMLSFFIPMIQSNWVQNLFITKEVQLTIYKSPLIVYQFKPIQHTQVTIGQLLVVIYLAGMLFLIGRFIWQMFVLNKIINQPDAAVAYSFFKKIRLVPGQADNHIIAEHERVHANQWHSADVLLIEAVMIVNWFNPVVYLYRFAIKHIHEYIADRHAIKSGTNKGDYALLLLSQTFNTPVHKLVNPFYNHSLLKQRIKMLQKNKSNRIALVKYGLSAPLFILMLVLSSATLSNSKTINLVNKKAEQVFLTPASAIQPSIILDSTTMVHDAPPVEIKKTSAAVKTEKLQSATDPVVEKNSPVFTSVELVPQFPGGIASFSNYLAKNIRYPANARENGIQGRVIISFVVERDGTLSDAHVTRGVADDIDKEALRVIQASPKWEPGVQNGRLVRVAYSVPISFALEESQPDRPSDEIIIEQKNDNKAQKALPATIASKADTNKKLKEINIKYVPGNPIYMVDGKEVDDLKAVNPDDIESMSILKDANATAKYGVKGRNGVVVVTTRKDVKTKLKLVPAKDPETKH